MQDILSIFAGIKDHPRAAIIMALIFLVIALIGLIPTFIKDYREFSVDATAAAIEPTQTAVELIRISIPSTQTAIALTLRPTETSTSTNTPSATPTATPQPFACGLGYTVNNVLQPSLDALSYLSNLKTHFLEDRNNLSTELTAGDTSQNTIRVDLWSNSSSIPWGNAEISTIIRRGQSIGLSNGYNGISVAYPIDSQGNGWTEELVQCEVAAHLARRIEGNNNIANIIYTRIVPNQYILAPYDAINARVDLANIIWEGVGDSREDGMLNIRGFVPLQILIELGLVQRR